ncbi:hypothetical protein MPTK1_3g12640 [Marchantia polymorpha subsp. ruderalis]|uniref:Tubby C-terminal domain-containing protein n=2 Tax=Marchantia polymorpha TaxID=3197 RepID=A0A176WFL1_MARPO|nr:hypothetical protein AXG93_150s1220 [Marchantia polymorpha subsp. ruderalis]PTQ38596.1 hypothetical protein MARPO_0050s0057 [Marchantia polymorpha]BBN05381.1 hypothetical protein Mp_3g12640 [Marchantia polymorpha subsp. ruderalis]|eukprot:PTQ38596.1 hypothetical protein MARPO_0050s0057 [Marchantia polymorpha]
MASSTVGIPAPVSTNFCVPYMAQFIIEQKVLTLSSGKFTIKDPQGNLLFQVKSKLPSLHTKRILCDSSEKALVFLSRKILTMHDTWEATSADGDEKTVFVMKKSGLVQLKPSFHVFLGTNTSMSRPDFTVKGDFFQFNYTICYNDVPIAEASRKINASAILVGKDQYMVTIQPGVDHAFIASLVVIMDQVAQGDQAGS